jgi:hypothetical protein
MACSETGALWQRPLIESSKHGLQRQLRPQTLGSGSRKTKSKARARACGSA